MAQRNGSSVDGDVKISRAIHKLQEKLLQNPVPLDIRLEMVQLEENCEKKNVSHDQLMKIRGKIPTNVCEDLDGELNRCEAEKTHIILVVDRSGSMSGNPFNQVKMALEEIISQSIEDRNKLVDLILYNNKAESVSFTAENYKEAISAIKPGNATSFKAAFDETEALMQKRIDENFTATVILFLTDGMDTVSPQSKVNEYAKKWKKFLKDRNQSVIVHSIGFTADHDLQFLQKIANAGTSSGLYRYCETGDGPQALRDKLEELFDYVSISDGRPVHFQITLKNSENKLVLLGSHAGTIDGVLDVVEEDGTKDVFCSCEFWIFVIDPASLPEVSVGIQMSITNNRLKYTLHIPCVVNNMSRRIILDACGKTLWDLGVLSRNIDLLTGQMADAITGGQDVNQLKKRLGVIQSKISNINVFKPGMNREGRAQSMNLIKDIQGKLDKLHAMLAQYLRGETGSVSLLARAHDIRYEAQFSKSRRQRLMDRRVAKNFDVIKSDSTRATVAREEDLSQLSDEALSFYYCVLSMCSVKEILTDASDLENAIGIGLAVARPEHVLDDPTSIRLFSISGSLVSRSSVMDALQFKINFESQLSAHGGFSFGNLGQQSLSYATVDAAREPINAWLPLYISPAHWERVKSCLRPSLGYLCTLDPLGYSHNQLDIMFMVLGSMIGKLWQAEAGEHQLRLIFALQRTCQACMDEFKLKDSITEVVKHFIESPLGRFRNVVPNLFTLIGYIASLPVSVTKDLLGISDVNDEESNLSSKLWLPLLAEVLRRASAMKSEFHESENIATSLLEMLLLGRRSDDGKLLDYHLCDEQTYFHFAQLNVKLSESRDKGGDLHIPKYNSASGIVTPDIKVHHSSKVDKAMELWAQSQCGLIRNKNRTEKVKEAKQVVKKWVDMVRERVGLPSVAKSKELAKDFNLAPGKATEVPSCQAGAAASEGHKSPLACNADRTTKQFDTRMVNSSIIEVSAKILCQLSQQSYPPLSSLPGCIGFLDYWITNNHTSEEMAANGELPPQEWIDGVQKSVAEVFKRLADFKGKCEATVIEENTNTGGNGGDDEDNRPRGEGQLQNKEDEEELDDDTDEEIAMATRRARHQRTMTLPMLLNTLNLQGDHLELIRAMLCQAISYPSNSQAREATSSGELTNLSDTGAHNYLGFVEATLVQRKEAAEKKLMEKIAWEIGNLSMLRADSTWAFIGYLLKTHKDRGEGFSALIDFILETSGIQGFPHLAEKIQVLLTGKYEDCVVFANGNSWIPDKKLSRKFETVLGEEAWLEIETKLLSDVHIHVYRESDIPNRHGHCNSKPYIPNRVRKILGMPLIDEKIQPRTSLRHHKSLEKQ